LHINAEIHKRHIKLEQQMFFQNTDLYKVIRVDLYEIGSSFLAVGEPSSPIIFQIPAVDDADETIDGEWMQITTSGIQWQLDSDNLALPIDGTVPRLRVKRESTSDNCTWK